MGKLYLLTFTPILGVDELIRLRLQTYPCDALCVCNLQVSGQSVVLASVLSQDSELVVAYVSPRPQGRI